jgi:hypothetical protein
MARTWVDIGSIYGGAWIGKAVTRLAVEADARIGATEPLKSVSFWTTVGSTVGVPLVEFFLRKGRLDVLDMALITFGGHISTNLLDYIEKYLIPKSYTEYKPITRSSSFPQEVTTVYRKPEFK